jgi:hypothetical protein
VRRALPVRTKSAPPHLQLKPFVKFSQAIVPCKRNQASRLRTARQYINQKYVMPSIRWHINARQQTIKRLHQFGLCVVWFRARLFKTLCLALPDVRRCFVVKVALGSRVVVKQSKHI